MPPTNQNPEQKARDKIDNLLVQAGWTVQHKNKINFSASRGVAVREYQTDVGPADYMLFVDKKPVGVIEAKKADEGFHLNAVEEQTTGYSNAKLKWINYQKPLPFLYESTGVVTWFTDRRDPKPRAREIFTFHRPEELARKIKIPSLRSRIQDIPEFNPIKVVPENLSPQTMAATQLNLRECQQIAITNLEASLKQGRPKALIQMATGAGKTYTAITSIYRLLKYARARRVLFLVDTRNLGKQAEQEMMAYTPFDDNRKFTELYTVQRPTSPNIAKTSQVVVCTIQRLYSILKGEELDESQEEINPAEKYISRKEPLPVVYNDKITPDFFDVIFIDECHRSIYNLWQQVLDYFDAFLIGLTATPDNRTYGFFKKNVVSDYSHEKAVADGVNVGNEIYLIGTLITEKGATIEKGKLVEKRERLTRKRRWEEQDEDEDYSARQLDRDIVNPDQIRTVIREFKEKLPIIFPERTEIPKTLVFAKTDSHADDIIRTVREEFGESNQFCKKITYKASQDIVDKQGKLVQKGEDPDTLLSSFRNEFYPRIAVTVDMIATGTDVKPLECLLFMRDVKSRNYFEQMKGRGTRTLGFDDLKRVTPSARYAKTHYVIVDAIGVTKSLKTSSQPLITKPSLPLKDLMMGIMMGAGDEDAISSLAGRLARMDKQLTQKEQNKIRETTGKPLTEITKTLLNCIDADYVEERASKLAEQSGSDITDEVRQTAQSELCVEAGDLFTGEIVELLDTIRREKEQTIDHENLDEIIKSEWQQDSKENAISLIQELKDYFEQHKDELEALTIYYDQPHRRRDITFKMIRDVMDKLKSDKPRLAPLNVWKAYQALDEIKESPLNELTALVALIRRVTGLDQELTPYHSTVRKNFQEWIFKVHAGAGEKFNEEQMNWLRMISDHISSSFHFERDDLDMAPFDSHGGLGKMYQLFEERMDLIINEMNEVLVA
ncbi:MAG: DEAD/DEAH box helicase family protein [Desulfamplus sp.]|nr:DEAD/DEAH box helicase family protein [Desulfamplus sp.]